MPQAELYDGTILEFEDGTPNDVIERVARQHTDSLRTEEARRPLPQGVKPSEAGGGRGFVQPTAEPAQAPAPAVAAPSKPDQQPWRIGGRGTAPVKAPPTKDQQLLESLTAPADGGYTASQIEEGTIEPGRLERMRQDRAAAAKGVPEARALSPAQEMAADFRDFTKNPVARGAVAGLSGLGQVGIGATRLAADLVGADSVADFAAATSRTAGTIGGGMTQDLGGNDKLVADVTASIMQSAPSLAVGTVGGPALSTLFTQTALAEYNEGRNSGFDVGASLARGGIMGMAEAVGERFGFPQQIKLLRGVVRDMPPNELAKTLGELIKKEIPGEQLTTALQFLADKAGPAAQNPNATFADYLEQAGETLKTTVAQTAVMGGGPAVLAQGRINDAAVGRSALTQAERLAMDKWGANPYAIANARGFRVDPPLVSDDAKSQRAKTAAIFENTAAQYGIPSGAVSRAKAAAEGLPIDQLGPFYSRFVQALQKRNLVGSQVDAHVIDSLEAGPVVLPEEREAQAAASGTAKAASGTGKPASAPPKTDTATAEPDYSGLSEPGGPAQVAGIDEAAHAAATSPQNDLQEPTPAQQDAGNYRKGHHRIGGLDVSIENPQGSIRRSKPNAPVKWETEMQHHYGYIRGTVGQDGDHIDTFVKPGTADDFSGTVFVVDQVDPGTGKPDEHKVMLGFDTEAEARDAYLSNYQSGWKGLGAITATPMADFKTWLKGDTNKPFGETTRAPQQPDVQPVAGVAERAPAGGGAEPAGGGRVVGRGAADAGRGGLPSAGAPAPGGGAAAAVGTGGRRSGAVEETTGDKINREWESNYQRVQDDLAGSSITDIRRAISYASRIVTRLQPAAFAGDQASKDQITGVRKEIAFLNDEIKRKEAIGPARTIGRVGDMPTQTAPLELRANADGTVTPWLDGFELVDFESGEPLRLPGSTSDAQAVAAIKAAGAVGRSKKFFGVAQDAAPAPKKPGRSRALDPDADTLLQALAKLGGVQRQGMASEFGLRPEELKHSVAVAGLKGYPFRAKGGLSVDAAIAAVREAGYLAGVSDKDARHAFEDAVHKELGGGQALTPQGEMSRAAAAHEEHAVHAEEMDQAANDERAAIMAEAGLSEAEMAAVEDDDIDVAGTSNTSTDAFMRAMGFTEEEITRETRARAPVGAQEDGAATGRKAGAAAGSGGPEAGPAAAPTEEVLTAPTATGLRGAAERRRRTEQSDRGKQRNLAAKAQADAERGEFALTGSDRPADVAAAAGQGGLFEAPAVSKNTIFTEDAAERARAMLRAKLEKPGGPGKKKGQGGAIDPEVFQAGITLAGYHIEKGARTFSAYAKAMLEDLGEAVRPYLKSWYAAVYYDPRATALQADMTPPAKLDEAAAAAEEQGNVRDADTGVERDRGDAGDVEREVGETLSGRGLGEGPQTAGKRTGSARRGRPDDAGVPTGGASPLRELGDQPVRGRDRAAEPSLFDAGTVDGERSDDPGIQGVQPDPRPAGPAARPAVAWASAAEKRAAQRAAEGVKQEPGIDNIRATLPYLQPAQQDDVFKAEQRFAKPDGYGMLFTNGTGTGKTFSGLGIVKRFVRAGKRDVLIVVPDAKIMADWIESGTALGLDIKALADTKDAGRGVTITTYANLGENDALATRSWDLVVPDEVHMLMQSADGKQTKALDALRAITLHPRGVEDRFTMLNRDDVNERRDLSDQITALEKERLGTDASTRSKLTDQIEALRKRLDQLNEMLVAERKRVQEDVLDRQGEQRTRVVGLSATPFAYEKTVDWADGYLFDYAPGGAEEQAIPGYNEGDARAKFFVQHFGYRMRYNKLTEPDSKVDRGLLQRQFNGWLKKQGVLSGRMLDVAADYDRRFILAESAVGNEIDRAIEWIREQAKASRIAKKDEPDAVDGWAYVEAELNEQLFGKTGHLVRRYLLEAIKAKEVVQHVREHMALGRKVVVFHDFKKGGSHNPFAFEHRPAPRQPGDGMDAEAFQKYLVALGARNDAAAAFRREFPNLAGDRLLAELVSPIVRFKKEFPEVLLINGDEKQSDLLARYKRFNDDTVGPAVALVQSAKNKGWSGHDTTGKHQRVLFNLGLPTQPTMSIQQEGRIYRTGQVSNAIFRYLNTGTNWERWAFAQTIAERASAAENLATGELARALKDAFIAGFEESGDFPAGHEGEGTGGKERDRMANEAISEYDRAKAFYWGTAKKTAKTKAQEGADYFATPEPVGFKMVQMLDLRGGEDALEPSAGHGAIARWFPETANRTAVEPSNTLGSRLAMVFDGKIVRGDFEALNIVNKYDGIAMNPPFGTAGRTAVDHLAKAAQQHLREGGRVVALIPTGPAADKKFDKWFYEEDTRPLKPLFEHPTLGPIYRGDTVKSRAAWASEGRVVGRPAGGGDGVMVRAPGSNYDTSVTMQSITEVKQTGPRTLTYRPAEGLHMVADIKLPAVTFERAGTQVMTRIVVLEKVTKDEPPPALVQRDYTGVKDINELFDRMEELELPPRAGAPAAEEVAARAPAVAPAPFTAPAASAKAEKAAATQQGVALAAATGATLVEHTTGKGKLLKGVIRKDLTLAQAKEVDEYTFKKDGGFFIRAEHLKKLAEKFPDAQMDFGRQPLPAAEVLEGDADPRDVVAVADLQGKINRVKAKPVTLTALPALPRPPAGAPRAEVERFAATELVNKLFGKRAVFFAADGGAVNGAALASQPKVLFVNEATRRPVMAVLGHELLHQMRRDNPQLYDRLADRLDQLVKNPGEHFMEFVERYTAGGVAIPDVQKIREELVADIVGDNFTDPAFWRSLQEGQPGLFQRVLGAVRNFLNSVLERLRNERPFGTDKYLSDVVVAREAVVQAMKEYASSQGQGQSKAAQAAGDVSLSTGDVTDTSAFRRWFGNSKVVDKHGNPLVVYHGTNETTYTPRVTRDGSASASAELKRMAETHGIKEWGDVASILERWVDTGIADRYGVTKQVAEHARELTRQARSTEETPARVDLGFSVFNLPADGKELGAHFGTKKQAEYFGKPFGFYLNLQNPMRLPDLGTWDYQSVMREARKRGVEISNDEYDQVFNARDNNDALRKLLLSKGIDGVVYKNEAEGRGDSYIAFKPEQIKSATGNRGTFDPSNPDISLSVDRHTPEQRAALARAGIDTRGRLQRAGDKIREAYGRAVEAWKDNWGRQFQQGYLDQFTGIAQAVERELGGLPVDQDPYVAARLANGGTSSVMRGLLLHGQAAWAANGQHLEKIPGTRGLLDILAPLGEDLNDFFGWMIGNRAARLAKEGRERNLTPAQIQTLQDLAKGKEAKFRAAALEYAAFKRSVLDIAEQAGLIDGEARKVWDNADYIPFYRKIDQEAVFTATGKKGLAGQSSGIRTLRGGEAALNDPLENIIMNFSRLVDASLKNRAIAKTVGLLEQAGSDVVTREGMTFSKEMVPAGQVKKVLRDAGTPDVVMDIIPDTAFAGMAKMWAMQPPSDPDIVRVMVGGSPRYYRVNDPLLLKALTSFVPFDFPGLGVLRAFKRILTAGVTAAPPFWIRNFVRDTAAAQLVGRDGFFPGKSLSGIVKSYRETGAGEAMLFSGASFQSGQVNAGDPAGTGAAIRRALRRRGFNAATAEGFVGTVIDTPARWWEHYRQVGDAIENSNREAIYEATTKAGKGATAAAYESKDLMDFTLRGSSPVYQFLADVLPFFNARVQGLYRLGRANPKRLAAYGMLMMAASLALAWLNEDNDEYNELPDWDKDNYWHFWIRGEHFRLPKPFELGVAFATIPERIMRYIRGQDTGKKVASRITHDIIEQFAFDPVPQAIRPALNVAMNRDTFRDRPIESMSDTKKQPAQRYSALTSPAAVKLAQAAEPLVNAAGLGPKKLEYLVNAYLGTVGAYALGLSDLAVAAMDNKAPAPARRLDDLPMVREFYRMDPPRGTVFEQDLYALRAEVEEIYATVQDKAKKGDKEGAVALAKEEATKLALRPQVKSATELLQDLNKKRDAIYADKKMTPEKKREEIDKILSMKALISKKLMGNPVVRSTQ